MTIIDRLLNSWNLVHSDHKRIARGMAWVMFFVLLAKFVAAAKEMAIAWRYGTSPVVDGYLFVFNLVNWPVNVWFSVISIVLIPLVARIRQNVPEDLPRFRAELLGLALAVGLALSVFSWIVLPVLLSSTCIGLAADAQAAALQVARWLVPVPLLGVLVCLYSAWMMSREVHVNSFYEAMPSFAVGLAVIFLPSAGVMPLVWGTVAGLFFQLSLLLIPDLRRGEITAPRLKLTSPHWSFFWSGFGVMLLGQAIMTTSGLIDQFFAAHLGAGAIATLSYASRIMTLVLSLGATAVSRSTLPVFSRNHAQGDVDFARHMAKRWAGLMLLASLPIFAVGWLAAPMGVKLLFERGAFTVQDTLAVTKVFRALLFQLPAYFCGMVLASWIGSTSRYHILFKAAVFGVLSKIAGNALLVRPYGLVGIAAATALMYTVTSSYFLLKSNKS